jgi:Co/Zn/Cd efflux system component
LQSRNPDVEIRDLHLWRIGPGHFALTVSLRALQPLTPSQYKAQLADLEPLSHVTIEVDHA